MITVHDIKYGSWKKDKFGSWTLCVDGTYIIIGSAMPVANGLKITAIMTTGSVCQKSTIIPATEDADKMFEAWNPLMKEILERIFV